MELPEILQMHEAATRQVEILERRLSELQKRPHPESEQEFNYTVFQISVVQGVKKMYETYRDNKWSKLQQEGTDILQEILDGEFQSGLTPGNEPPTPPQSPPSSTPNRPAHRDPTFFDIPPPLTPIRDRESVLMTPPASSDGNGRQTERFHLSRNLSLLFSELPRDL